MHKAIDQYIPDLTHGDRVLFRKDGSAKNGQVCSVFEVVPNPSRRSENQWYDVRFDDYAVARVHGRFLQKLLVTRKETVA
jgi:hypothetical protein